MKNILAIGLIGGLLYLGSRVLGAKRLSDRSIVRTLDARIARVTLQGITLAADIYIDNPTNTSVQVTKPVVTVTSKGKYIASSIPSREQFTIAPLSQTTLGTTEIDISWSTLSPYVSGMIGQLRSLIGQNNLSPQSLRLPLEYYYTVYVDNLFYQSNPEPLV